jgi:hypothetical protein
MRVESWVFALGILPGILLLPGVSHPAAAADRWRIENIPLDMPLDEDLDGEFLEGMFQEKIGDRLQEGLLTEWPIQHSSYKLKGERSLELYFSSAADHRRIFWIRENRPLDGKNDPKSVELAIKQAESSFAPADRVIADPEQGGSVILLIADKSLPPDSQKAMLDPIPNPLKLSPDQFSRFWQMDLQERATILGPDFRGAVVLLNVFQGKLTNMQAELIDLKRAQTVLNLISR